MRHTRHKLRRYFRQLKPSILCFGLSPPKEFCRAPSFKQQSIGGPSGKPVSHAGNRDSKPRGRQSYQWLSARPLELPNVRIIVGQSNSKTPFRLSRAHQRRHRFSQGCDAIVGGVRDRSRCAHFGNGSGKRTRGSPRQAELAGSRRNLSPTPRSPARSRALRSPRIRRCPLRGEISSHHSGLNHVSRGEL